VRADRSVPPLATAVAVVVLALLSPGRSAAQAVEIEATYLEEARALR